jgi:LacI family transcriptional regulator
MDGEPVRTARTMDAAVGSAAVPPRRRRTTLNDVAQAAGLSAATVSYALRGLQVPEATQVRVREVARQLGYEVNPIARALASGRTGTVGVLFGSLEDLWQQDLAMGLSRALMAKDRYAIIADANGDPQREERLVRQLLDQHVDGILVSPLDPEAGYWAELTAATAVVTIGDALPSAPDAGCVLFDNRQGVATALQHLAGLGHHRVAVFTPALPRTPERPADLLATEIGAALGLEVTLVHAQASTTAAATAAAAILGAGDRPTAAFAMSDSMAYGVYLAAQHHHLRIPEDLSVLGYDDHLTSRLVDPALTTLSWDEAGIVATGVDLALSAIEDGNTRRRVIFEPEMQVRASTSAVGRRRPPAPDEPPTT